MEYVFLEKLNSLRTEIASEYKIVRKTSNRPSRSSLMITRNRGSFIFVAVSYKNGIRTRRIINDDTERIYRLANKAYANELARRLKINRDKLGAALSEMQPLDYNSILHSLPKHFDILDPDRVMTPQLFENGFGYPNPSCSDFPKEVRLDIGSMDPYEWAALPYCENTKFTEHKIHKTAHGISCRSKSEAVLFEIYDSLGIPFHYDEVMTIGGQQISPDFTGARRDGKLIFHEHIGMHDDAYRSANDWKPALYASAGIFPGINLIYTYDNEAGALNTGLAREIIKDIYRI